MKIGVFGATGLIGRKFIQIINENSINCNLKLFASEKSIGKKIIVNHKRIAVNKIDENSFKDINYAFFFVPASVAKYLANYAKKYDVTVIDNSSCFRMNEDVPLVIDEINGEIANKYKYIANPNCTTIQAVLPLFYLDKKFSLKSINFATYQSLSGGGNKLLKSFKNKKLFESVSPFIGDFVNNEYTDEEIKMIKETKKILKKDIEIRSICVRTSSLYCHGCYVDAKFEKELHIDEVKKTLKNKRIILSNELQYQKDRNDILILRLRIDYIDPHRLQFFCIADNLRVGAAYNSFLIGRRLNIF